MHLRFPKNIWQVPASSLSDFLGHNPNQMVLGYDHPIPTCDRWGHEPGWRNTALDVVASVGIARQHRVLKNQYVRKSVHWGVSLFSAGFVYRRDLLKSDRTGRRVV